MNQWTEFDKELTLWGAEDMQAAFWLRDDDAINPTNALDRLLGLNVPVTIAAIPQGATAALAARVHDEDHADIAVHGFAHKNHASAQEKKQEIGLHRGREVILGELAQGLARLQELFGARLLPLLVPPWNRIDPALIGDLPALGFTGLSTYGGKLAAGSVPIRIIDTHIDIIDWRGSRGGRPLQEIIDEMTAALRMRRERASREPVGILAHHLVHDDAAWRILDELADRIAHHDNAHWTSSRALLAG